MAKKHQLGNSKPKGSGKLKSRIAKASSNSGGGHQRLAGKGGPGQSHEKQMKGSGY